MQGQQCKPDLPITKVTKLRTDSPIDKEEAINGLGGDENMFIIMLQNFSKMSIGSNMSQVKEAYDKKDFDKIKSVAHTLKGACAYVGAGKLHYICYFIQDYWVKKEYDRMLEYYPSLVEAVIELKVASAKLLADHEGKTFIFDSELENCVHSDKFYLDKHEPSGFIYCVATNQTLTQRIDQKARLPSSPFEEFESSPQQDMSPVSNLKPKS